MVFLRHVHACKDVFTDVRTQSAELHAHTRRERLKAESISLQLHSTIGLCGSSCLLKHLTPPMSATGKHANPKEGDAKDETSDKPKKS